LNQDDLWFRLDTPGIIDTILEELGLQGSVDLSRDIGWISSIYPVLQNDIPAIGLGGSTWSKKHYKITVPPNIGNLKIKIWGGSGDCDLYVKHGQEPSISNYDYSPYLSGNDETVNITNPTQGDWYIMLRGYLSYSGVSLKATYQINQINRPPNPPTLIYPPNDTSWQPKTNPNLTLKWLDNGDPDGDNIEFWLYLFKWNGYKWVDVTPKHDVDRSTSYHVSLDPYSYYAWGVFAVDWEKHSDPWYTFSAWRYFTTKAR